MNVLGIAERRAPSQQPSTHPNATSVIEDYDSRFRLLGADLLFMPMRKTRTEIITPIVGGSVSFPSFTIENSATDCVTWQDATYTGLASSRSKASATSNLLA